MAITVFFENEAWMPPLRAALEAKNLSYTARFMDGGVLDMSAPLEPGVYVNRMSPSSHTRGHQSGVCFVREYLGLLESRGCRIINGSQSFRLEVSKVQQYAALQSAGILIPHTVAVTGTERLVEAARAMPAPFITKHNQGGKGLGVQLFRSHAGFEDYIQSGAFENSPDAINLLQQYVEPAEPFITRIEIVDGKFLYALRSSTEDGFELCPSDACSVGESFCPAPGSEGTRDAKFQARTDIEEADPLVQAYIRFCREHAIDVAGIEFVEDAQGRRFTYDINCTSNYNAAVEHEVGVYGMDAIAALCERELSAARQPAGVMLPQEPRTTFATP